MTGFENDLYNGTPWLIAVCCILGAIAILLLVLVSFQPTLNSDLGFSVSIVTDINGTIQLTFLSGKCYYPKNFLGPFGALDSGDQHFYKYIFNDKHTKGHMDQICLLDCDR